MNFPEMPPALPDETDDQYTDRLTGADGTGRVPYDHHRNRQCSIGYHDECSDPSGERCKCPCHSELRALDYVLGQIKLAHEHLHDIDTAVTALGDYPDFDDASHEIEVAQRAFRNLERIVGRWEAE